MRAGTGSFEESRRCGYSRPGPPPGALSRRLAPGVGAGILLAAAACAGSGGDPEAATDSPAGDSIVAAERDPGSETLAPPRDSVAVDDWFLDVDWRAIGTEPFWGIDITRDNLVYSEAGEESVAYPPAEPRRVEDGVVLSSVLEGRRLEIILQRTPCSDGMSDRRYEWSVDVTVAGRELEGCVIRDPFPSVVSEDGAIDTAGLAALVESARRVRSQSGRYERIEGTLGRHRGADADFVGWFDGESIVSVDLRITRGEVPLFETSYFFDESRADGPPTLRLVESDRWEEGTREHTSHMIGFGVDGTVIGGLYEVEGEPSELPAGLADGELAGARDLVEAAVAERGRERAGSGDGAGSGVVGA